MSLRKDGHYRCDRCGTEVGNGDVQTATKVIRMHPEGTGEPETLHLCREPRTGAPRGCAGLVLGPRTLANWSDEVRNA